VRANARRDLRQIWMAPNRATAERAIETFRQKCAPKCARDVACLEKDRTARLTFFDFPAGHWEHLRTSAPIESVFATVRHRTIHSKGALSQDTARLMEFKLVMAAAKTWRRLKGENQLPRVINGVIFKDGVEITKPNAQYGA
jgi:transposase-like protein